VGRPHWHWVFLSHQDKLLLAPFLTFDFGKFGSVDQSRGGTVSYSIPPDQQAWHYVIGAGLSVAFYGGIKALVGPATNPNDPDGDGIDNEFDKCPDVAEDHLPPLTDDGCPSDDTDNDGIRNADDKCPTTKEDGLLPDPKDGCPTNDRDQDGVPDDVDKCPTVAEDKLPPDPTDGCPSTDRDGDGIPNDKDACPDQPETFNGIDDEDGCPDQGRVNYNQESKQITISEKIFFKKNSAEISRQSLSLIGEVAGTLKHMPQVELVEVAGHADATGKDSLNLQLTQSRSDSVRYALIDRGVDPRRLTAVGYGNYCPVAQGNDAEANEKNRRVEFQIVRISGKPTEVKTTCDAALSHGIKGTDPNGVGEASVTGSADQDPPSDAEVRKAVAKADASLLFPDYHGCAEGEPGLTRVVVLATKKVGTLWQTKVDGLVTSSMSHQPEGCWSKPEEGSRWKALFDQNTTVTVHLMKIKKHFKVVLP
jgi:outer membrane protein OmpA-like peptidoglycan-associated protein